MLRNQALVCALRERLDYLPSDGRVIFGGLNTTSTAI
jgi:hypothetical protein